MKFSGETKIIAGSTLFALIPVGVKMVPEAGIESLLFGRLFFASLFLLFTKRNISYFFDINKKEMLLLALWAGIMCGAMLCYFAAIKICGVALSSSLLGVQPIIIAVLAAIALKEKISVITIVACALTLAGICCVSNPSGYASTRENLPGILLAGFSACLLALNFIFQKKYLPHISSGKLVFFQSVLQLPMLFPFIIINTPALSINYIAASAMLGIFCTVLTYLLIYKGAIEVKAQKIGVLQSIEYMLPVFIGYFFYSEKLSLQNLLGIILIAGACLIINTKR